jgi:hypothetical protein
MAGLSAIAKIGAPAIAGGLSMFESEDADAMFLGAGAKMADKFMMGVAQKMTDAGVDPKEIFKKTGWFEDPVDKKWKWEIDDMDSKLMYMEDWENVAKQAAADPRNTSPPSLESMFKHDELFQNYPELADIPVGRVDDKAYRGGLRGSSTVGQLPNDAGMYGGLKIAPQASKEDVRSTMLHEIQHGVQSKEDFSPGGNDGMFHYGEANKHALGVKRLRKQRDSLQKQVRNHQDKYYDLTAADKDSAGEYIHMRDENERFLGFKKVGSEEQIKNQKESWDFWKDRLKKVREDVVDADEAYKEHTPMGQYKRLGGETEARNVQSRDNLMKALKNQGITDKTRRDYYPPGSAEYSPVAQYHQPFDSKAYKVPGEGNPRIVSPYNKAIKELSDIAQHGVIKPTAHPTLNKVAEGFQKVGRTFENHPLGLIVPGEATGNWLQKLSNKQKPTWQDQLGAIMDWL